MHLATVGERSYSCAEGVHVAFHNQVPAVFLGIFIAELNHFLEFPFRVDVHQRERNLTRCEGFLCQADHDGGVLTDAVQHDRILEFGGHLTDDIDRLGFEFFQVAQIISFFHDV